MCHPHYARMFLIGVLQMSETNSNATKISEVFRKYCRENSYQVKPSENDANDWRLEISDFRERTIVIIYHTGCIVVGGRSNRLKKEFDELKQKFDSNPQDFLGNETRKTRACATRYAVILTEIRERIKGNLRKCKAALEITDNPSSAIGYRAKITATGKALTLTQYNNGTLFLQGKEDTLFHNTCDWIEKIANPAENEVIARFISCDERNLEHFCAKYTPKLLELAEKIVREELGDTYEYLETHDQKWFIASECLCLAKIPLPEFSPLVMPASKAFEGFAKKLLVGIGLFEVDHFKRKNANFSTLNDRTHLKRRAICDKEKYGDTMLKKISLCLDTNRNFMMHSDESKITKVDSQEKAEEKVDSIFKDTKEIFDYFNDLYSLLPK